MEPVNGKEAGFWYTRTPKAGFRQVKMQQKAKPLDLSCGAETCQTPLSYCFGAMLSRLSMDEEVLCSLTTDSGVTSDLQELGM